MYIFSIIALLIAFTAHLTTGWHIPPNQPNGLYSVVVLPNGTEQHTFIAPLPSWASATQILNSSTPDIPAGNTSFPDDEWATNCYTEEGLQDLDHRTCDLANAALDFQCDGGKAVRNGYNFYSISECVVAYFCHFWSTYSEDAFCFARERREVSALITKDCGWYKPGSAWRTVYPDTESERWRHYDVSYGYESYCTAKGHDFCFGGTGKV
ncbi:hypothetical protein CONLIGDRAFT_709715 [Coniochaeta ligniaria NRRL 30616]|uniref:Uncharacterized protein n=1 Tax=Coniochaeta ligniaria NRRL 30616 TaxID=1408157 RepID=A0A1J7J2P6_9PEZI|nr:hypothetical protein CONLIGDRAFT_709715 [Coniochaeta ligniaria NRRL 30616]